MLSEAGALMRSLTILSGLITLVAANPIHASRTANSSHKLGLDSHLVARAADEDIGYGLAYLSATQKFPPTPYTYHFLDNAGEGVDIYIIDSGVNDHDVVFEGRLEQGKTYADDGSWEDVRDHGTSVASFAGSTRYGSAKKATIWSYKVYGSSKPTSDVVAEAVKDIVRNDKARRSRAGYKGAVINISMALLNTADLEDAVDLAISQKIAVVTAAGNTDQRADSDNAVCKYDDVICVGAINEQYKRATFRNGASNWGPFVRIMAPGHGLSGYVRDGTVAHDLEGTSFASPYVAGIVATYYGVEGRVEADGRGGYKNVGFGPAMAWNRLRQNADEGYLGSDASLRGSADRLANNGFQKAGSEAYLGAPACNQRRDGQYNACNGTLPQSSSTGHATTFASTASAALEASRVVSMLQWAATATSEPSSTAIASKPSVPASPICWPTGEAQKPFPTNIASPAIGDFSDACNDGFDKPTEAGERAGCILSEQPAQLAGAGDDDLPWINMSVEQIWWAEDQQSADDVGGELQYVMAGIMSDCQTNNYDSMTIGGWTITGSDSTGYRRWNLTGLPDRMDPPAGFEVGTMGQ